MSAMLDTLMNASSELIEQIHDAIMSKTTEEDNCLIFSSNDLRIRYNGIRYNCSKIVWLFHHPNHKFETRNVVVSCGNKRCLNIDHMYFSHHKLNSKEGVLERIQRDAVKSGECLISPLTPHPDGYVSVGINGTDYKLQRVVWWTVSNIENIQDLPDKFDSEGKYVVRHRCRTKACVNPDHYEIGTHADNSRDKIRDGTHFWGERSSSATITLETAQAIADSWKPRSHENYKTQPHRAKQFDVDIGIIRDIDRRKSWPEVQHPNDKCYMKTKNEKSTLLASDMTEDDWSAVLHKVKEKSTINNYENKFCGSECWEQKSSSQIACMSIRGRSKFIYIWACEYACKRFIDNSCKERETVRHICGNGPKCVNPAHLQFGNAKEQAADKRVHGTSGKKLTIEIARAIRNDGRSNKEIAIAYSLTSSTVSEITGGRTWKEEGYQPTARQNKITIEKARAIRSDKRSGKVIAAEYSVSATTISDIRTGKIWTE